MHARRLGIVFSALALAIGAAPGSAKTPCDQTCTAIKQIIDARAIGFTSLRGAADTDPDALANSWTGNLVVPGLQGCNIVEGENPGSYTYACSANKVAKADAQATFHKLYVAFHAAAPSLRWFKLVGGPKSTNEQPDSIQIVGGANAKLHTGSIWFGDYGSSANLQLEIESAPTAAHLNALPYKPKT